MGTGQFVGRSPDVHAGVGEVVEVDERALEPQTGTGVGEVSPGDPASADQARGKALVEPGQCILGGCGFCFRISIRRTVMLLWG